MQSNRKTLPGRDYIDPAIFELERQNIFFKSWYYAGREEQAACLLYTSDAADE